MKIVQMCSHVCFMLLLSANCPVSLSAHIVKLFMSTTEARSRGVGGRDQARGVDADGRIHLRAVSLQMQHKVTLRFCAVRLALTSTSSSRPPL